MDQDLIMKMAGSVIANAIASQLQDAKEETEFDLGYRAGLAHSIRVVLQATEDVPAIDPVLILRSKMCDKAREGKKCLHSYCKSLMNSVETVVKGLK